MWKEVIILAGADAGPFEIPDQSEGIEGDGNAEIQVLTAIEHGFGGVGSCRRIDQDAGLVDGFGEAAFDAGIDDEKQPERRQRDQGERP